MRKHFILLIIIFIAGMFFNALHNGNLKACGTKATACKTVIKKYKKNVETDSPEETDPFLNLLVNPLIH